MPGPSSEIPSDPDRRDADQLAREIDSYRTYLMFVAGKIRDGAFRDREGTSDLVQQSMMSALASIRDGQARLPALEGREIRAWLRRVLINTHRDAVRHHLAGRRSPEREQRGSEIEVEADTSSPASKAEGNEEARRLADARGSLDDRDQQFLAWWFEDDLSFTEIGQRLGLSPSGARKACRKAAERLKVAFERGDVPEVGR